jgi:hypothetical protein
MHWHTAPVADTAVAVDVNQPLNIHRDFTAKIALDDHLLLDNVAQPRHFIVRQLIDTRVGVNTGARENFLTGRQADTIQIRERDFDALLAGMSTPAIRAMRLPL